MNLEVILKDRLGAVKRHTSRTRLLLKSSNGVREVAYIKGACVQPVELGVCGMEMEQDLNH